MTLEPIHLQIAGVVVLVLVGIWFVRWIMRAVGQPKRGRALYMLGEVDNRTDDRDDDDDDGDGDDDDAVDVR